VLADKPFGEWNKFRIIQVGERLSVCLNDHLVVDHGALENYFEKDRRNPPIIHRGPGRSSCKRTVGEILPGATSRRADCADERTAFCAARTPALSQRFFFLSFGFSMVKDLTGWALPVDSYESQRHANRLPAAKKRYDLHR